MKRYINEHFKEFIVFVALIYVSILSVIAINKQADKIQNLEEKLNIYKSSYEEFCLEDSLKQSDVYE